MSRCPDLIIQSTATRHRWNCHDDWAGKQLWFVLTEKELSLLHEASMIGHDKDINWHLVPVAHISWIDLTIKELLEKLILVDLGSRWPAEAPHLSAH